MADIFLDKRTQGQKGDIGIEDLIETNLMFFCSFVYKYKNMSVVNCFF